MRKHQQKQILKLIKTIEQAQSSGLYADCQEGAISIGNFIENIEGESTQAVTLLEEYCELLYKASRGEIKEKLLRKHLIKIENSVTDELKPNKIEIAFFPYKASMWDSLESVYLAAKADPNCDAYVVPIPSYELNPDGTLGKMYYDGDQYPGDIPVVDWQTYDIEARHPDVVFTHYAYDDNVNNATIHPDYYSKHLREHCELLVYIPYFVAVGDTVDEYCGYLPGVLYADYVIVESEPVRQSYIAHYKKYDKEFGWNNRFGKAEKKFLALGSPKFDRIFNTKREDYMLPPAWESLIRRADGSRKKVVLYNTHMFTWINTGEEYFEKIHSVFDSFRSRDDVVLWWRPHPNTEMNFRVKRPQWLSAYKTLVEDYKREGLGIYDDSPDLNRAIAWSDAYYGDMSSLVALFRVTGKPVMIQEICKISTVSENDIITAIIDFVVKEGVMWFIALNVGGIFTLDLETNAVRLVTLIPNEVFVFYAFCNIDIDGDYVILTPHEGKSIMRYNISDKTLEIQQLVNSQKHNFISSYKINGMIYMFPHSYSALAKYDIEYGNVTQYNKIFDGLKKTNGSWFSRYGIVDDDGYITLTYGNAIVQYDTTTNEYSFRQVGDLGNVYWGIEVVDDCYWLIPYEGNIVKWNKKTGETREIADYPVGFENIRQSTGLFRNFISSVVFEKNIYLIPFLSNMILKINTETDKIEMVVNLDERAEQYGFSLNKIRGNYQCAKRVGNYIYAFSQCENALQKINPETGEIENISVALSKQDYDLFKSVSLFNPLSCTVAKHWQNYEYSSVTLPFFLEQLGMATVDESLIVFDGLSGQKIYNFAKEQIGSGGR